MVLSMTEKVMAKELAMVWSKMEKVLVWSMKGTAFVGAAYFSAAETAPLFSLLAYTVVMV